MDEKLPPLELAMRDFGPIGQANVVLKPLTVFVGPSGSGKSFAASAVYSYANAAREFIAGIDNQSLRHGYSDVVSELLQAVQQAHTAFNLDPQGGRPNPSGTDRDTLDWISFGLQGAGEHICALVSAACAQLLHLPSGAAATRWHAGPLALRLGVAGSSASSAGGPQGVALATQLLWPTHDGHLFDIDEAIGWAVRNGLGTSENIDDANVGAVFSRALVRQLASNLRARFGGAAPLYFPAGRLGIAAVGLFTDRMVKVSAGHAIELSGPASPYFDDLRVAGGAAPGEFSDVIDAIEQQLHGGRIEKKPGSFAFPILQLVLADRRVEMEQASSSVADLAPVTFMLRHLAKTGGWVILEEPEAHLHPQKQMIVAAALVKLMQAGLKLVVTTHSEYIVDTLGWIARSTYLGVDAVVPGVSGPVTLQADDIAVYRFRDADLGQGFTAEEQIFKPGDGFNRDNWLDIAGDLFNRHADLAGLKPPRR